MLLQIPSLQAPNSAPRACTSIRVAVHLHHLKPRATRTRAGPGCSHQLSAIKSSFHLAETSTLFKRTYSTTSFQKVSNPSSISKTVLLIIFSESGARRDDLEVAWLRSLRLPTKQLRAEIRTKVLRPKNYFLEAE